MVYVTVPRNGQGKHVRNVHVPKIVTSTVGASPPANVYACQAGPVLLVARAVPPSVPTVASATPAHSLALVKTVGEVRIAPRHFVSKTVATTVTVSHLF